MAAIFDRNSEQGFVFASLMEFFSCWSSKHEAALSIQCKQGRANLSFTCSLGEPDQQHVEVKKVFKRKKKSPSQINRDNSRAAARAREEAAKTSPPPPPEPDLPPGEASGIWQPSELNDTEAAKFASVPLSPGLHMDTSQDQDDQDEDQQDPGLSPTETQEVQPDLVVTERLLTKASPGKTFVRLRNFIKNKNSSFTPNRRPRR